MPEEVIHNNMSKVELEWLYRNKKISSVEFRTLQLARLKKEQGEAMQAATEDELNIFKLASKIWRN